jgi:hypothetical protein
MNKLAELFKGIKKAFTVQRTVEFAELKISIILENMTTLEELKVLEACKDFEGGAFIEALKKSSLAYSIKQINDIVFEDQDVTYEDEKGKIKKESKYLFLLHQIESWPAAVRDILFEAFNNLHTELEELVKTKMKFERFSPQPPVEEFKNQEANIPEGFHKLEKEETVEETEVDKLNKRVAEEQAQAQLNINKNG